MILWETLFACLSQHVMFLVNCEKVTTKIGSLEIGFCWQWGPSRLPQATGKDFQMPVADALRAKDLHCEIATCNGKELNLFFHILLICEVFCCFYGYICSSHGTNISFSVFH